VQFGTATHFIEGILDYVHTDVWGPTKMASIRGNHYFVSFIDDYSGQCWVYNMKHKGKSGVVYGVEEEHEEKHMKKDQGPFRHGGEDISDHFL